MTTFNINDLFMCNGTWYHTFHELNIHNDLKDNNDPNIKRVLPKDLKELPALAAYIRDLYNEGNAYAEKIIAGALWFTDADRTTFENIMLHEGTLLTHFVYLFPSSEVSGTDFDFIKDKDDSLSKSFVKLLEKRKRLIDYGLKFLNYRDQNYRKPKRKIRKY